VRCILSRKRGNRGDDSQHFVVCLKLTHLAPPPFKNNRKPGETALASLAAVPGCRESSMLRERQVEARTSILSPEACGWDKVGYDLYGVG
jgi:hypothetical protein